MTVEEDETCEIKVYCHVFVGEEHQKQRNTMIPGLQKYIVLNFCDGFYCFYYYYSTYHMSDLLCGILYHSCS